MKRPAFTLVELLVVIAIIGLLSTVAVVSLDQSRISARNAKRKADLVQISKALELYYADNASYPVTSGYYAVCGGGGLFSVKDESGANGWIPNLAPTYMATLPRDPNTNKTNPSSGDAICRTDASWNCYVYMSDGTNYSIWATCTPEGVLLASDPFSYPPAILSRGWRVTNNPAVTDSW